MGAPSYHPLFILHNQVCCQQPCFQLSRAERNLLLFQKTLGITLNNEKSEWLFFFFFKCFLATRPIPQSRRYKSRRPVQLSGTETPRSRQQEGIKLEWPSQEKSRPSQSVYSWFVVCAVHREAFPNSPKSFFNQVMFCSFNMWSIIHLPAFFFSF